MLALGGTVVGVGLRLSRNRHQRFHRHRLGDRFTARALCRGEGEGVFSWGCGSERLWIACCNGSSSRSPCQRPCAGHGSGVILGACCGSGRQTEIHVDTRAFQSHINIRLPHRIQIIVRAGLVSGHLGGDTGSAVGFILRAVPVYEVRGARIIPFGIPWVVIGEICLYVYVTGWGNIKFVPTLEGVAIPLGCCYNIHGLVDGQGRVWISVRNFSSQTVLTNRCCGTVILVPHDCGRCGRWLVNIFRAELHGICSCISSVNFIWSCLWY